MEYSTENLKAKVSEIIDSVIEYGTDGYEHNYEEVIDYVYFNDGSSVDVEMEIEWKYSSVTVLMNYANVKVYVLRFWKDGDSEPIELSDEIKLDIAKSNSL